ncbi:hypothetical protein CR513_11642, partial [Mucuna pruriens]
MAKTNPGWKRKVENVLVVHGKADTTPTPVIMFSERDISKWVAIKGVIELETTFRECSHARIIPMLYTIFNVDASYNIIIGRLALDKLGVVAPPSTYA